MNQQFKQLAEAMRREMEAIPQTMRQDAAVRQALVCLLYQAVKDMGLIPLPAWKPPLSTGESIDLVGVNASGELPEIKIAFAVDPLVELPKVKAMKWVECPDKVVVTFSQRKDKVEQSTFFLTPALEHINLYD
jgi:hypothetical protein